MDFSIVLWAVLAVGVTAAVLWIVTIVGLLRGRMPRGVLIAASALTVACGLIQVFG